MAIVIELELSAITEETVARALLQFLEALDGFEPRRYDLNQKQMWRAWDLDRAVVDLLTQRTQLFAVAGEGGTALIATGKHGEVPTVAVDGEASDSFDESLLKKLPVRDVRIVRTP